MRKSIVPSLLRALAWFLLAAIITPNPSVWVLISACFAAMGAIELFAALYDRA